MWSSVSVGLGFCELSAFFLNFFYPLVLFYSIFYSLAVLDPRVGHTFFLQAAPLFPHGVIIVC